ncbi:MAG: TAXI family TRAP transporter solute-binding subunit [Pseudanabaenaceae cyanobacterium SKYGB_i_bin29]|nr:TAXI family TRAP transporter solute-binding subunit [Pseudanabaenaceae cyanobacterium SKYG29]MDW8421741.1 TAXI family TRAP transporter solute-binding subunit [Pseudanabaenaceae cyanobacterium SKYGB_i_bin29]
MVQIIPKNINPFRLAVGIGLGVITVSVIGATIGFIIWQNRPRRVRIAAGNTTGESYIIAQALAQVVKANYPRFTIEVVETAGTSDSLKRLQAGEVSFAAAQADIPAGDRARLVANLYTDYAQLLVPDKSPIRGFGDLKGKRIALQPKGGQYDTFVAIARHFGYEEGNFIFLGTDQKSANQAYKEGRADAAFFVRALGNKAVVELIPNSKMLPIDQGKALQTKYPAFNPTVIPQGIYRGNPPIPASDIPTIAIQRTLLADKDADFQTVEVITRVLYERRQDLARAIPDEFAHVRPLVTSIDRPSATGGTGIPIHAGAIAYYDKDKPSFIQENADYVALIITIVLLVWSWVVELKNWIDRGKKDAADIYIDVAVELMQDEVTASPEENRQELDRIFMKAARDLVDEKISEESFRTFNEAYKTAREVLERRIQQMKEQQLLQQELLLKEAEAMRKENADHYITEVLKVAKEKKLSSTQALDRLDKIMQEAGYDLIDEKISQESFRTFIEAYKTVRDIVARQPLTTLQGE